MKNLKPLVLMTMFSTLLIAEVYKDKEIALPPEENKELELPEENKKPPIELFDELDSNAIEPLDGVWKSVFDSTKMTGCSSMMQSMLKQFTPPSSEKTLKFSKPFNPNKDFMSGQFKWTKVKENYWKGSMYKGGAMPQGMGMDGKMLLGVVSKKKMKISLEQTITLPKAIAQMMGSGTTCTVVTKGHYIKTK